MKEYGAMKTASKWSTKKVKIVTTAAKAEVKSGSEVVREAIAEISHNELKLVQKQFDSNTGTAKADLETTYDAGMCDNQIESLTSQITELTAQKAGWTALKTDLAKL